MPFSQCGNLVLAKQDGRKIQADQVASLIAPGGVFARDEPPTPRTPRPKVTTYSEAYPGLQPAPGGAAFAPVQGRFSVRPQEATADRIVVREPLETWRESLKESRALDPSAASREWNRQRRTREEQERRWRRWMKSRGEGALQGPRALGALGTAAFQLDTRSRRIR
ncbi:unnamed protein product [Effrenium voratum]|nr:unnamed protein product [Effrenium voratum]